MHLIVHPYLPPGFSYWFTQNREQVGYTLVEVQSRLPSIHEATSIRSAPFPSVQPHEARPRRDLRVAHKQRHVRPSLRPLEHDRARTARDPARDQELLLRAAELHPANLVEPSVHEADELEARLDAEDRDRVPTGVLHARVPVRDVDERLREAWRRLGHEDLRSGHRGARGQARG